MLDALHHHLWPNGNRAWTLVLATVILGLHLTLGTSVIFDDRRVLPLESTTVAAVLWIAGLAFVRVATEWGGPPGDESLRRGAPHGWGPNESILLGVVLAEAMRPWLGDARSWYQATLVYIAGTWEAFRMLQPSGRIIQHSRGLTFVFPSRGGERIDARLDVGSAALQLDLHGRLSVKVEGGTQTLDARSRSSAWRTAFLPRILQLSPNEREAELIRGLAELRASVEPHIGLLRDLGWVWTAMTAAALIGLDGGDQLRLGWVVWIGAGICLTATLLTIGSGLSARRRLVHRMRRGGSVVVLGPPGVTSAVRWTAWATGSLLALALMCWNVPLDASWAFVDPRLGDLDRRSVEVIAIVGLLAANACRVGLEHVVCSCLHEMTRVRLHEGDVLVERPMALEVRRRLAAQVSASIRENRAIAIRSSDELLVAGHLLSGSESWHHWAEALSREHGAGYR